MENCFIYNKYGLIKVDKIKKEDMSFNKLECVIKGSIKLGEISYPYILGGVKEPYLKKIKTAIKAMKEGVQYIILDEIDKKEKIYWIVVYKKENFENAVLYKLFNDKYKDSNNVKSDYIFLILRGFSDTFIRRSYLNIYINNIAPVILKKPKMIYTNKKEYMKLYHQMKKYDNFADFDSKIEKFRKNAIREIELMKESRKFKNAVNNIKSHNFIFSIKNSINKNPLYDSVKKDVEKYAKSLDVIIKN